LVTGRALASHGKTEIQTSSPATTSSEASLSSSSPLPQYNGSPSNAGFSIRGSEEAALVVSALGKRPGRCGCFCEEDEMFLPSPPPKLLRRPTALYPVHTTNLFAGQNLTRIQPPTVSIFHPIVAPCAQERTQGAERGFRTFLSLTEQNLKIADELSSWGGKQDDYVAETNGDSDCGTTISSISSCSSSPSAGPLLDSAVLMFALDL
jgi:hypothetical protein